MSFFDLVLVIIVAGFALFGLWFGLIHTLGSLLGTLLGVFLAARYYSFLAEWLAGITGWTGNFPKVVMFTLAFVIINRLVGLLFWFVDRTLSVLTRLPFLNGLNRLLGLAFGAFEGMLVLGIIFYFIDKFPVGVWFMGELAESRLAPFMISTASILWPLLPEAVRILKGAIMSPIPAAP